VSSVLCKRPGITLHVLGQRPQWTLFFWALCCVLSIVNFCCQRFNFECKVNVKDHSIQKPVRCKLSVMWVSCIQTPYMWMNECCHLPHFSCVWNTYSLARDWNLFVCVSHTAFWPPPLPLCYCLWFLFPCWVANHTGLHEIKMLSFPTWRVSTLSSYNFLVIR